MTVLMDRSGCLHHFSFADRASVAQCLCRNLQLTRRSTSLSFLRPSLTLPIQHSESTTCHANIDLCTTAVYIGILNYVLKHISGETGHPQTAESTASEFHSHTASVASSNVLAAKSFPIATYLLRESASTTGHRDLLFPNNTRQVHKLSSPTCHHATLDKCPTAVPYCEPTTFPGAKRHLRCR